MNSIYFQQRSLCLATFALSFFLSPACSATPLVGAGSSAAAPVYQAWSVSYGKTHDVQLAYDASGSSTGLKKIRNKEVSFGASDVAPSQQELDKDGLLVVPTFVTGVVPVINVPRVASGKLRLDAPSLAAIFMGEITRWNAPQLKSLNPSLNLPDLPIKPVVRSDGSGTTYYFSDYLSRVSPAWQAKLGTKNTLAWPEGFTGEKGNAGVAKAVKETVGAIGYVEYNYVLEYRLNTAQLRNASDEFVGADVASFSTALRASDWFSKGDFHAPLTNRAGKSAWPITMGTFVLLPKMSDKPADTTRALQFFVWALLKGDHVVEGMNFVRLPEKIQALAYKALTSVTDVQGRTIGLQVMSAVTK